ncbi:uncharacterized protein PG998_000716 [Apiospora kogelbergensis]|uniref:uncharacterized protein n=1 Tax=Apiospora kogelbergensis TaxID=1337665 RepID=UPI00312E8D10
MLPTPDTSHVAFERVYEPAEDSYLLLDTLSSESETAFLRSRFGRSSTDAAAATTTPTSAAGTVPAPFVVEIGPGSGVVIGFVNAHATHIFGTPSVLTAAIDVNRHACAATQETARKAAADVSQAATATTPSPSQSGTFLDAVQGDLTAPLRPGSVDVLIFNPPYVPTEELPRQPTATDMVTSETAPTFQDDSYLLSLSYAGGGCAYVLLCAQNKPEAVKQRIRAFGPQWRAETVGSSGKQAGWEKLQIVRIWREDEEQQQESS